MEIRPVEIFAIKKMTDFRHLNLFEIDYRDQQGRDRSWQLVSRQLEPKCQTGVFDRPDAVVIVPFHSVQQQLVVIREFRVPLGDYQYGFPAGLVDGDEGIETAVARELMEETGLQLTRMWKSSPSVYSTSGMTDESVMMVYVECEGTPTNRHNQSSEDIETLLVTREMAAAICRETSHKIDVKAWLVLSIWAESGHL
jgi:ADP-ribose pyrophosphatase